MFPGPSSALPGELPGEQLPRRARWQVPRLHREGRVLGGVAAGIAEEIGVDAIWVRLAFVVLTTAGGFGVVAYGAAWLTLTLWEQRQPAPAERYEPEPKAANPANRVIAIGLITVGLAGFWRAASFGVTDRVAWPAGLAGVGILLAWHRGRTDRAGASWLATTGRAPVARIVAGLALATAGIAGFALLNVDLNAAGDVVVVTLALVVGVALLVAPWASAMLADLAEERRRRIRSEERARMAAHLHDSVLQTLALIQRNAHDPARMTSLARRQERELRSWLYGPTDRPVAEGLRASLETVAAEVEELHGVAVEVVVVGDTPVDGAVAELLAAAREAIVNAAKHSGARGVDVFAEARPDAVDVFVRDTGVGFDPATIPADRLGLSESIVARLARIGGKARIESAPGEGTEVELSLPRALP